MLYSQDQAGQVCPWCSKRFNKEIGEFSSQGMLCWIYLWVSLQEKKQNRGYLNNPRFLQRVDLLFCLYFFLSWHRSI